ncbi:MAG: radical SAM protein, partial [Syntrophales bacterium]
LEVFLLAGVTGILSEVEKTAGLVRQIQPQRVQLNTVSRPPCEEFACPVSWNQMKEFANLFDGKAEVLSEGDKSRSPLLHLVTDADILALLSRRPCTIQGVSAGLGLQVGEAAKRLQALSDQRAVIPARGNGAIFYQAVRTKEERPSADNGTL